MKGRQAYVASTDSTHAHETAEHFDRHCVETISAFTYMCLRGTGSYVDRLSKLAAILQT